ncbi:MAG: M20/M25/M40 family metallo-hydrolase [Ruminococcus sp.]|nr:M20/M25/M40 family metallo-hydrolase [Ruminococcus sp.]
MNIKAVIKNLVNSKGISGNENSVCETALNLLKEYCPDAYIKNGNVIGKFGSFKENRPHILLDAHIDQVGMIVTYITDDGFIKVGNVGGLDRRLLPAQQVTIHGEKDIKGIICSVPPHLTKGKSAVLKIEEVSIDTGYSKEELEKIVTPGDMVTFDTFYTELLNDRITASALDDRCGIASVLYALDQLKDSQLECNVTVLFSAQEELGERGAKIACYEINPDIALAVDVSFGYTSGDTEHECGKLGDGAMIGISPSLSREISDTLINTAKNNDIPYQLEVMSGLTSTNADRFSVSRNGVKACTVSIPLRYMHTPVEVIDINDVKLTGRLIAQYLKEVQ